MTSIISICNLALASSIKIDNQGYRGAARVQPIVVGNTVLFAQERGGVVRDFSYVYTEDSFVGKDLTILARHLFENRRIKAWAYAQAPYSIAWVVLDNGALVSLTYLKEHDVWAWTRHESGLDNDAVFEDVTVIAEGNEDVPYFLVKRTIGGQSRRYIERLHSRVFQSVNDAFFVDCGLAYSGAPATAIGGLAHLEGQKVVALADGNVVRNLTVTGGAVKENDTKPPAMSGRRSAPRGSRRSAPSGERKAMPQPATASGRRVASNGSPATVPKPSAPTSRRSAPSSEQKTMPKLPAAPERRSAPKKPHNDPKAAGADERSRRGVKAVAKGTKIVRARRKALRPENKLQRTKED